MNRVRTAAVLLFAALSLASTVGVAEARDGAGAPEAAASPHTRTDPAGDCASFAGPGGANCDLLKIKIVNGATQVKLVATYRGAPYLPVPQGVVVAGGIIWHLEGDSDYQVYSRRDTGGTPVTTVQTEEFVLTCSSSTLPGIAPVVGADRVTVTIPRSCLPGLTTLRAFVLTEKVRAGSAAVFTDRAPNAGFTTRIAQAG